MSFAVGGRAVIAAGICRRNTSQGHVSQDCTGVGDTMQDAVLLLLSAMRVWDVLVGLYGKRASPLGWICSVGKAMAMHLPLGRGVCGQHSWKTGSRDGSLPCRPWSAMTRQITRLLGKAPFFFLISFSVRREISIAVVVVRREERAASPMGWRCAF